MGFKPFLEGGIAAIIAGALTHPLDLIKVRMQLQGEHSFSLDQNTNHNLDLNLPVKPYRPVFALDSLIGSISLLPSSTPAPSSSRRSSMTPFAVGAHIVKTEGPAALFSGVSATVLRQMLYSATRMGNFPLVTKIAAGLIAGAVGSAVGNPADVAMVRMQADGRLPFHRRRNYKSVVDAIERIVRHEGVSSLWRGSWLTVNRAMIVTASQLATYDHVKEIMIAGGRGTPGGIGTHAAASFAAGIVAAVASNPIDVVKTRMMNAEAESYGGPLDCAVKTVAEEGPMALYKGLVPTVTRQGPFTMILFVTLEQIRGKDTSNYLLFRWSLTTFLKSSNNLVETVAIRNVRVNHSDHQLMVDILIFPLYREGFTQTTLALVTFAFSNQDYKPPPIFGSYFFRANTYPLLSDGGDLKSSKEDIMIVAYVQGGSSL
ncbi:hypothetical protein YC2023_026631 [Brassica napus]